MGTPDGGDTVAKGQRRVGIVGDIGHGKIRVDKAVGEAQKGHHQEHEVSLCQGSCHAHPGIVCTPCTENGKYGEQAAKTERNNECEMSEFRNHNNLLM